jgi:hypothetical protein
MRVLQAEEDVLDIGCRTENCFENKNITNLDCMATLL